MPDPSRPTATADPTALPTWTPGSPGVVTLEPPTTTATGTGTGGSWLPEGVGVDGAGVDFEVVDQLRARVASRLATGESGQFSGLEADAKIEFIRALAVEELRAFVLHRQMLGQPVPSEVVEDAIIEAVVAATGGLGRLEPLLRRADVEDIFFSGTAPTVLRLADGSKVTGPPIANTDEDLLALLRGLSSSIGDGAVRELSPARPLLALRLKSVGDLGGRLSAAIDVTPHPAGTIRVHRHSAADLDTLHAAGMVSSPLRALLRASVQAGATIMVSGGPGHGKTTLLRALAAEIPREAMIVTIEDDRELGLHVLPARDGHGNILHDANGRVVPARPAALVRAYEARPANAEGAGRITMADLGHQSLRDSPDVVIYGEARGGEIVQLLEGITSGIAVVMCTIHADSCFGVFERIVQLVRKAAPPLPVDYALRAATSLDLIVQVTRNRAHERFVTEVVQVTPGPLGENGYPRHESLFAPGPGGRAVATGRRVLGALADRLAGAGFDQAWLDPGLTDWPNPPVSDGWGVGS